MIKLADTSLFDALSHKTSKLGFVCNSDWGGMRSDFRTGISQTKKRWRKMQRYVAKGILGAGAASSILGLLTTFYPVLPEMIRVGEPTVTNMEVVERVINTMSDTNNLTGAILKNSMLIKMNSALEDAEKAIEKCEEVRDNGDANKIVGNIYKFDAYWDLNDVCETLDKLKDTSQCFYICTDVDDEKFRELNDRIDNDKKRLIDVYNFFNNLRKQINKAKRTRGKNHEETCEH